MYSVSEVGKSVMDRQPKHNVLYVSLSHGTETAVVSIIRRFVFLRRGNSEAAETKFALRYSTAVVGVSRTRQGRAVKPV